MIVDDQDMRPVLTAAILAVVSGMALMLVMRSCGPGHAGMPEAGSHGMHSMSAMWSEMGWMMAIGPIAMVLFFGGIVTFIVTLVGSHGKQSA